MSFSGPCWSPQRTGMSSDVRRAHTWQPKVENKSLHVKEKGPFSSPPHACSPESQTEHINPPCITAQRHQKSPRKVKRSTVQGRLYSPASSSTLPPPIPGFLLPRLCGVRTAGRRGGSSAPEVLPQCPEHNEERWASLSGSWACFRRTVKTQEERPKVAFSPNWETKIT